MVRPSPPHDGKAEDNGAEGSGPVLVFGVSGGGGREELIAMDKAPARTYTGPLGSPDS